MARIQHSKTIQASLVVLLLLLGIQSSAADNRCETFFGTRTWGDFVAKQDTELAANDNSPTRILPWSEAKPRLEGILAGLNILEAEQANQPILGGSGKITPRQIMLLNAFGSTRIDPRELQNLRQDAEMQIALQEAWTTIGGLELNKFNQPLNFARVEALYSFALNNPSRIINWWAQNALMAIALHADTQIPVRDRAISVYKTISSRTPRK